MMDKNGKLLTFVLILFFLSPIFIIFYYFNINIDITLNDFVLAFKNSAIQSVSAAFLCTSLSFALVPGLVSIKNKWMNLILTGSLLPSVLPSIFTILIVFSYFKKFPFGHLGIIFIFFVTYFGFSTLTIYNSFSVLLEKYSGIINIYNISIWDRFIKIYLPLLKQDLINVFLIIILGCFSSLSVPLLAGGGRGANVELLIYESIYIRGEWATASIMALFQIAMMFSLSLYLNRQSIKMKSHLYSSVEKNNNMNLSFVLFFLYIGSYILGYLFQVLKSFVGIDLKQLLTSDFLRSLEHSLLLSFCSIFIFLVLLISIIYLNFLKSKNRFLMSLILPSSTVVGFSIYLFFNEKSSIWLDVFKLSLGLNLIYSLALYRSYIQPSLNDIQSQLDVCRIYGISFFQSVGRVILPQIKKTVLISSNIIFIFSFCEFALMKSSGVQSSFSGVFIENLISTYRLEQGFMYSAIVLIIMILFYFFSRFIADEHN